ncbi:hypothetical protein PPACK8108_LOCUS22230 [Phakopsora pachyrhizi]|uniref:Uncharacterized protein n=1 Tax=Phakopsora pachyrhizi TaxID=170000 RepID=A0AAV0BL59_PHAPC|nr:hypothetical protein PPACK8108_LOCUS22230 [Phakopsora pachyrhizi]
MRLRRYFEAGTVFLGVDEVNNNEISNSPGDMNFDKTSWVAYKGAKKAFANSAHQKIEDTQEDPRETKSKQCLSDNEHKRWDESYQVADAIPSSVIRSGQ